MPLTIRPKEMILDTILSAILAGTVVTDINPISVTRQLSEAVASTQADLEYELYNLLRMFYISTAEGVDLDARGNDMGLARDPGQAASDVVRLTKDALWIDDIPLTAPVVVQATLLDGTQVLYRSLGNAVLQSSGRSISGQAPGSSVTGLTNDGLVVNLDGDGPRAIALGSQTNVNAIAATIQAVMRGLAPLNVIHQAAYTNFRCDYGVTTAGAYTLRSGTAGPSSSVVVTAASTNNATVLLKLGTANGGIEQVGQGSIDLPVVCDTLGTLGNVGAGQINAVAGSVPGIVTVANPFLVSNGREPASDDAYRQDIRAYLLGLGRGTTDAIGRVVARTVTPSDGQQHVISYQVASGAGIVMVYVCDGRSLTVGAQNDTIQAVQDELDGLGSQPGGWIAAGSQAGVVDASVIPVPVDVLVRLGSTADLVQAQQRFTQVIYQTLLNWKVGASLSYVQLGTIMQAAVPEVLDIVFTLPREFHTTPPAVLGDWLGSKVMPSTIVVRVQRG